MSDEAIKCPSCGGQIRLKQNKCSHCGRWMAARGISFYALWAGLTLIVIARSDMFFTRAL
jgi:DNA-directed RNA polymerase subunit RPC12/RpoP